MEGPGPAAGGSEPQPLGAGGDGEGEAFGDETVGRAGALAGLVGLQHLAKLRRALVLTGNGAGPQEAAKASGVFWKAEREFIRQMRSWRLADLDTLQPELLEADKACKSAGSPDGLIAERLALTIAARAKRLGL